MKRHISKKAQTALEYMLLLAIVAAVTLVGFKVFLPRTNTAAGNYFNVVAKEILGPSPTAQKVR